MIYFDLIDTYTLKQFTFASITNSISFFSFPLYSSILILIDKLAVQEERGPRVKKQQHPDVQQQAKTNSGRKSHNRKCSNANIFDVVKNVPKTTSPWSATNIDHHRWHTSAELDRSISGHNSPTFEQIVRLLSLNTWNSFGITPTPTTTTSSRGNITNNATSSMIINEHSARVEPPNCELKSTGDIRRTERMTMTPTSVVGDYKHLKQGDGGGLGEEDNITWHKTLPLLSSSSVVSCHDMLSSPASSLLIASKDNRALVNSFHNTHNNHKTLSLSDVNNNSVNHKITLDQCPTSPTSVSMLSSLIARQRVWSAAQQATSLINSNPVVAAASVYQLQRHRQLCSAGGSRSNSINIDQDHFHYHQQIKQLQQQTTTTTIATAVSTNAASEDKNKISQANLLMPVSVNNSSYCYYYHYYRLLFQHLQQQQTQPRPMSRKD